MSFSSITFLFYFLPISVLGFSLFNKTNSHARDIFLVVVSLFFYGWTNYYLALGILIYSIIIFLIGKCLEKDKKKTLFIVTILVLIAVLSYYKYSNFIINNLDRFLKLAIKPLDLYVPLGISFIVFETISYLADVYNKKCDSGTLLEVMSFILFFPKVLSGPIVLWRDYKELFNNREISFDKSIDGLERIIIGLAKKVLIADVLAVSVRNVYANYLIDNVDVMSCWLTVLAYSMELYFDFSGYSDVALGISKIFGFDFKENFNFPYLSTSVGEFWRRWHISLGSFFREYVYIPLGGNRKKVYRNLFIVFVLTGLWHGSTWPLILWGLLHGLMVVFERYIGKKDFYVKTPKIIKWFITIFFVMMTWMLFNMASMSDAIKFYKYLFGFIEPRSLTFTYEYIFNTRAMLVLVIATIGAFMGDNIKNKIESFFNKSIITSIIKYVLLLGLLYVVIIFVANASFQPFLYFQF